MELIETMNNAIESHSRREYLCKHIPICPKCENEQVQLLDHLITPAEWRCRSCRHSFLFVPKK